MSNTNNNNNNKNDQNLKSSSSSSSVSKSSSIIRNQRWVLKQHPKGKFVAKRDLKLIEEEINLDEIQLQPDEFLIQSEVYAVDAFVRTVLDEGNYHGGTRNPGSNIVANGYGKVIKTGSNQVYKVGTTVLGVFPVAKIAICPKNPFVRPMMPLLPGQTKSSTLSIMGMSGMTAYFGLFHPPNLYGPTQSDTVVISAAAGSVGCCAIQMAKLSGVKRVVGIAGGKHKKQFLIEELHCDGVVDYKDTTTTSLSDQLDQTCPDGIDFYFDNVGGEILDVVLTKVNKNARVVICGAMSQYDTGTFHDAGGVCGPSNYLKLAERHASMTGFSIMNYLSGPSAIWNMFCFFLFAWWHHLFIKRNLKEYKHVEHGIEKFGRGIEMLFDGGSSSHIGRLLIDVDGSLSTHNEKQEQGEQKS